MELLSKEESTPQSFKYKYECSFRIESGTRNACFSGLVGKLEKYHNEKLKREEEIERDARRCAVMVADGIPAACVTKKEEEAGTYCYIPAYRTY